MFSKPLTSALCAKALVCLALLSPFAASATLSQPSGTLSDTSPTLTYNGGPIAVSDPEALCPSQQTCEDFPLTTIISPAYLAAHPNAAIEVVMTFSPGVDMALKVLKGAAEIGASDNGVGQPEAITFPPLVNTNSDYKIRAYVFAGAVSSYTVTVKLLNNDIIPGQPPTHTPRFAPYPSPSGLGDSAGEPSVSYNRATKRAIFQAGLQALKVTFPEQRTTDPLNPGGLPESCDALWEDKTFPATGVTTLDPIGTGTIASAIAGTYPSRIYSGQLGPKSHIMAFTDDDGVSWTPSEGNVPGVSGVDHQTIGVSPYAITATPGDEPLTAYPYALYYCGQDVAYANCARSDNGGLTFGAAVPIYNTTQCGGLHGHIRGGPNGTVYVPNKGCGSNQGVAYTRDNGTTWTVSVVPDSTAGSNDPQAAVAADNTVYFCYGNGDGRPKAAVGKFVGASLSWAGSKDLGTGKKPNGTNFNIVKVVFPQGVAGDGDRASCAFLGTETAGNTEALDFEGIWHAYIATTYDGGANWVTVQASGNDPVQGAGGICTSGTTCGANRNLLDFNDMTIDEKGRPIFGFADGCVGACVTNSATISRADKASIIRMVSDKTLFKALDRAEPYVAKGSCLAGSRTADGSALSWKVPVDDGTATISKYRIYRGTTPDVLSQVGETADAKALFSDTTALATVPSYYYRVTALNAAGEGVNSNQIKLDLGAAPVLESVCLTPGLTILEDAANDTTPAGGNTPQLDLRKLSISQPYFANGDYKIYFNLKMQSLAAPLPVATWPINFCSPAFPCIEPHSSTTSVPAQGTPYGATNKWYTVRMTTDPGIATGASPQTPIFQVLSPTAAGITTGSRTVTNITADGSGFVSAGANNGLITIVSTAVQVGLTPAGAGVQKLRKFQARVAASAVAVTFMPDSMPDALFGAGEYTSTNLAFCAPNTAPLPDLAANVQSGPAPLTVNFIYGGTDPDAIDNIVEYRLDFGDGSAPQVFSSAGTVSHSYAAAGNFPAKLRVKDSRGLSSVTDAQKVIEVVEAPSNPQPFSFIERTNVALKSFITSEEVVMSGYTGNLQISVNAGLQYSIQGAAFTNAVSSIGSGKRLSVRHISASTENTPTQSSVTVGGYSTNFKTTTTTLDRIPDAFSFASQSGLNPNVDVESNVVTPVNYNATATVTAGPGVTYRINGGGYTSSAGKLNPGDTLQVKHKTNSAHLGYAKTYLKVGGLTDYFTTRTK